MTETLRQAEARLNVIGYLAEKHITDQPDPETGINVIDGYIVIKTDDINFVRLQIHASEFTRSGKPNKLYAGYKDIEENYHSIAEAGEEDADYVHATGELNPYTNRQGISVMSYKVLFLDRVSTDTEPKATYTAELYFESCRREFNKAGEETGRVIVTGQMPTFTGIESVSLICGRNIADIVSATLKRGKTYLFLGDAKNNQVEVEREVEVLIGTPRTETYVISENELIVTGISAPYEENAFSKAAIEAALREKELENAEEIDITPDIAITDGVEPIGF